MSSARRFEFVGRIHRFVHAQMPMWELFVVIGLFALLVSQLLSFPVTSDPDPDGYVSYARYIQAFGQLPLWHRRLPGYPLFIAFADWIGPGDSHHDVYWAQLSLAVVFVGILWIIVRRYFGRMTALIFLALYAAPNFQLYYSVVMFADFAQQLLWLVYLALLLTYLQPDRKISDLPLLLLLAGLTFISFVVHPGFRYLSIFFLISILILYVLGRFGYLQQKSVIGFNRQLWEKVGLALLLVVFISVGVERSPLGAGMHNFHRGWIAWRISLCLPPVTNTPLNQQIEAFKDRASAQLGNRIEFETPNILPDPELTAQLPRQLPPQWERVLHNPRRFIGCGLNELRLRHHIIAKQYLPFSSERRLLTMSFLPLTDTPTSRLYRLTGIELQSTTTEETWGQLAGAIAISTFQILTFYGLTILGLILLYQRFPAITLALMLTIIPYIGLLMLTLPLEARYLNPFAPFLYLGHAVAILWLGRQLVNRFRIKPG